MFNKQFPYFDNHNDLTLIYLKILIKVHYFELNLLTLKIIL